MKYTTVSWFSTSPLKVHASTTMITQSTKVLPWWQVCMVHNLGKPRQGSSAAANANAAAPSPSDKRRNPTKPIVDLAPTSTKAYRHYDTKPNALSEIIAKTIVHEKLTTLRPWKNTPLTSLKCSITVTKYSRTVNHFRRKKDLITPVTTSKTATCLLQVDCTYLLPSNYMCSLAWSLLLWMQTVYLCNWRWYQYCRIIST